MKGLILKDLLFTKENLKILAIMIIGFTLIGFTTEGMPIGFYIPMFCIMICISTFSYDEYNKWDAYAITLPLTKKQIVLSKYLYTLISVIISTLLGLLVSLGIQYFKEHTITMATFSNLFGTMFGTTIFVALLYPFIYKYGSQKGRMFLFAVVAVIILGFYGVSEILKRMDLSISGIISSSFLDTYGIYIFAFIMIIFYVGSYLLSVRFYTKKEF